MLLQVLAIYPAPSFSVLITFFPMCYNIFLAFSNLSKSLAPTIKVRVPAVAAPTPPLTGESTKFILFFLASLWIFRAAYGEIVEQSITIPDLDNKANNPLDPKHKDSTWVWLGSMVTIVSVSLTINDISSIIVKPFSWYIFLLDAFTSYPNTLYPPRFYKFNAIGPPIFPSPINPTLFPFLELKVFNFKIFYLKFFMMKKIF